MKTLIAAALLGIACIGCVTPPNPQTVGVPSIDDSREVPVPEWIGQDYHDVKVDQYMKIPDAIRISRGITEDQGNGRKRIEFFTLTRYVKADYTIKTDENGIITDAKVRKFRN